MKRKATKRIVVHHTAGHITDTLEDVRRWHKEKGFTDAAVHCGYHYFIDGAGVLHPDRPDDEWGCAVKNANQDAVHVCVAGNFDHDTPMPKQIEALVDILIKMVRKYRLRYWNIYPHRDIKYLFIFNTTQTNCCGNNLINRLPDVRKRVAIATEIKNS